MPFAENYIKKQDPRFFVGAPGTVRAFELAVVIPCFNEPDIIYTIRSLYNCTAPSFAVAIVVIVNDADNTELKIKEQNQQTIAHLDELGKQSPEWISLYTINATNLPAKHAGAGWARKIGMDWAISHFKQTHQPNGIIISLDADTLVDANYIDAISSFYKRKPEAIGATLYFEHPLTNGEQGEAITWYELYMRYYKHALEYTGFPHSIYTVGSCFSVTAKAYVAQGGMNRRKAGEDFYFLHKLMPLGQIGSINNTTVRPSSRLSDRVPFGTGPALQKYLDGHRELQQTYPLEAFLVLRDFFKKKDDFYLTKNLTIDNLSENEHFLGFLRSIQFIDDLTELIANCSTLPIFQKRFFHLFNAFQILKWLNYALLNGFEKSDLLHETWKLLAEMKINAEKRHTDPKLMLKLFRELDKAESFA